MRESAAQETLAELQEVPGLQPTAACLDAVVQAAAATIHTTATTGSRERDGEAGGMAAAVSAALGALEQMEDEGIRPGAAPVLALLHALECTPLVRTHSDGWREKAEQRRAVLECVGRWDGADGKQGELRWAGRTPKERSEQRRIFMAVQQRLWDPL